MLHNTDSEWEKLGADDPYFAVLSVNDYHKDQLTAERLEEFFRSGEKHIKTIFAIIRKKLDSDFSPKTALDYGCGVGRIIIPLSNICDEVVGLDVSESMLTEAKKNCAKSSIDNVRFLKSDEQSDLSEKFDLVHSFIVFQHIPVNRGEKILKNLLTHLNANGVGVFHFTFSKAGGKFKARLKAVLRHVPFAHNFYNLFSGRSFFYPQIQMNLYDLNEIFFILNQNGVEKIYTEFTNHAGNLGMTFYLQLDKQGG